MLEKKKISVQFGINMHSTNLIPILQTSIGPAILISGIGLLLLTMTNRLGRAIDRARSMASHATSNSDLHQTQLVILWQRARILKWAISFASFSALCAAFLIITLFLSALFHVEMAAFIAALFLMCIIFLIISIVLFIQDVNQSLSALRHQMTK